MFSWIDLKNLNRACVRAFFLTARSLRRISKICIPFFRPRSSHRTCLSTTEVRNNNSGCILFDLDGTIFDSLPGIDFSLREAFAQCELPLKRENLRELIGPPIRTILSLAGEVDGTRLDDLERSFRKSYDEEGWQRTVCFPDAIRVLRKAHLLKYRLFVVSNKPRQVSMRGLSRE